MNDEPLSIPFKYALFGVEVRDWGGGYLFQFFRK